MPGAATQAHPNHLIPQAFNMPVAKFAMKKVNLDNRTLEGVMLAQVGEAKGHNVHVEESFLTDMVNYIEKKLKGELRSNFNHNWNNQGFQLGRFSTIKKVGTKVTGTLSVFEAADESPILPNMGNWFLKLASEDPGSIMCSIRFIPAYYYQYDKDGNEVKLEDYDWWTGRFENENPQEPKYVKFGEILSCDIVAEGALTESLFQRNISGMSTETQKPEEAKTVTVFTQFIDQIKELTKKVDQAFSQKKGDDPAPPAEPEKAPEVAAAAADPKPEEAMSSEEVKSLKDEITALTKKMEELAKSPADSHTRGKKDPSEEEDEEQGFVSKSPVTQKAIERYDRMIKNQKTKSE